MPTTADPAKPDLRAYVAPLRRRKWWITWTTALCVAAASAYAFTAPKKYSATAQLLVQPTAGSVSLGSTQQTISPTDVATEIQLATSAPVEAAVQGTLKFKPSVKVAEAGTTNVITITSSSKSASQASLVANTYANQFVSYQKQVAIQNLTSAELQLQQQITGIESQLGTQSGNSPGASALGSEDAVLKEELAQLQVEGANSGGIELVGQATTPKSPSSPKKGEDIGLGFAIGLILAVGLAYLVDFVDDAVYSKEDLERLAPGSSLLGLVPMVGSWKDKGSALTVSTSDPTSLAAEAYRSLRTSLQFASYDEPIRSLLVTSPTATQGKTTTVANLGVMFAVAGRKVLVVSGDLRRPRLGKFFGTDESVGISSVMIGDATLDEALQEVEEVPGLQFLGCGPVPPNPAELLASRKMAEVMEQLVECFDVVVVDSPPLLPVTDPVVLAKLADMTVLVIGAGLTKKGQLERANEQLRNARVGRIGIILNEVSKQSGYGYGYGYGYGKYEPAGGGDRSSPSSAKI